MFLTTAHNFDAWRNAARLLLAADVPPEAVHFRDKDEPPTLFANEESLPSEKPDVDVKRVPREFVTLAEKAAWHRDGGRWDMLYRVLWRITHGENHLLEIASDDDVHRLLMMEKAVRRDIHKMHAFVRFRQVETEGEEHFVAWHRPDHHVVRPATPFFARRFPNMRWTILTPDESANWDLSDLTFGPGVPADRAPEADRIQELWKTYYASIFNPARIKLKAMKKEMPIRHWRTLPEAALIPQLVMKAPERVAEMIARQEGSRSSARDFLPDQIDMPSLCAAAATCQGCDLHRHATQTVFGEGPLNARMVLVGEQPGDEEDRQGRPFVGPAGQELDSALQAAGVDRKSVYVTNVVKHFKYEPQGKRRIHQKPDIREQAACKPWLEAELNLIQPQVLVCLGATAAQAIVGRDFRISERRGEIIETDWCSQTIVTFHPSAILRVPNEQQREKMRAAFVSDLAKALTLVDERRA
ncbi:MAG: UdgX family uracil-DNA binding protein [Gemmataceae bacterium]